MSDATEPKWAVGLAKPRPWGDHSRETVLENPWMRVTRHAATAPTGLAADYLVMAAWLAYLKSRLLLPEPPAGEEPSGQEMADALQWQLRRLEAMQEAGVRLMARPQLGRDIFVRGQPEGVVVVRRAIWDVKLYDLLHAYGAQVRPKDADTYQIAPMEFFSVEEAAERLGIMGRAELEALFETEATKQLGLTTEWMCRTAAECGLPRIRSTTSCSRIGSIRGCPSAKRKLPSSKGISCCWKTKSLSRKS